MFVFSAWPAVSNPHQSSIGHCKKEVSVPVHLLTASLEFAFPGECKVVSVPAHHVVEITLLGEVI
jgi:hypothetical protein